ncbi:MAG TPA: hypothetical protein G4O12_04120 [Dehalococcoidia bacterium]|nr:hypothetical protein [Dehalococcoidia bacterium]
MKHMRCECPVCDYRGANHMDVARHMYDLHDEKHIKWIEPKIASRGLSYPEFIMFMGNLKLLAEILEDEAKNTNS